MKIPKCLKTVTGKHSWSYLQWDFLKETYRHRSAPSCKFCGIFDDRDGTKPTHIKGRKE